jgi:hypothetical protein
MSHGLAVIPEDTNRIPAGGQVRVILLDDFCSGGDEAGYPP